MREVISLTGSQHGQLRRYRCVDRYHNNSDKSSHHQLHIILQLYTVCNCWVMPGFHHSVAVLPLPFRRCRYTNSVSAARITLLTWKIPLRRRRCHLPLRRNCGSVANRIESYFCRSAVGGQPISVLVTSSLCIRKDVSSISVLTHNGNDSYGAEERQRNAGN